MKRVLVVDDQRAFVESLAVVIDAQDDLECVGISRTGADAVRAAKRWSPNVVVMDIGLPDMDGIEATRQILAAASCTRVVVLTGRADATTLARAAAAGAAAFLLKDSSLEEIVDALRQESTPRLEIYPDALRAVIGGEGQPPGLAELTQRELEVLAALSEGHQPKQIARQLGMSLATCRGHIKSLFQKLGAHSALEAVVNAHRLGVIQLRDPSD